MTLNNLKGLVIGCGSIGERHLNNLKKIGIKKLAIYDEDKNKVETLSKKYSVTKFFELDNALRFNPDFSLICTWPESHVKIANACISNKSHLFIEKPISSDLHGVESMLRRGKSKNLKIAVGFNTRFEKGLCFLKKKLQNGEIGNPISIHSQWGNNLRNWIHPKSTSGHHILKKGGGVILENGSHELDYLTWIMNDNVESVYCKTSKIKGLKTKTESLASIILNFKSGTIASLDLDYIRPRYERKCHVIGDKGDLKWEFQRGESLQNFKTKISSTVITQLLKSKKLSKSSFHSQVNDMYMKEMNDFLSSIIQNRKPMVDGWSGFETLKISLAALKSSKSKKAISI